jgi:hypothetical protein
VPVPGLLVAQHLDDAFLLELGHASPELLGARGVNGSGHDEPLGGEAGDGGYATGSSA